MQQEKQEQIAANEAALETLRQGMFAPCNRGKLVEKTEEGIDTAMHLLKSGYLTEEEVEKFPGVTRNKKIHPVIECVQNIPCNPCQDACPKHCIKIGSHITALPAVDPEVECIGCGLCVSSCRGFGYDRGGKKVCEAEVVSVKTAKAFDHTNLLTIKVPTDMVMRARFYKAQ